MILKKIEFSVLDSERKEDSEEKEESVLLKLDPSNFECDNLIYAPRIFLVSSETKIRKQ
jgi:hypothetical protein